MPLFCGTSLARRIESAEAHLILAATEAARRRGAKGLAIPVAGGFACFAESASPMNKVVGLGFDGVPDGAAWDEMERAMFACGVAVQVELSNLADPDVAALLADRGYRLVGFENVLGHGLRLNAEPAAPHGIEVRATNDIDAWVDVVVEGFAHPDSADSANEGVPSHEEFPRDVIDRAERDFEQAGAIAYVAMCDGVIAGGGSVRLTDGIAQLTGAATAPAPWRTDCAVGGPAVESRPSWMRYRGRRHRSRLDLAEERPEQRLSAAVHPCGDGQGAHLPYPANAKGPRRSGSLERRG